MQLYHILYRITSWVILCSVYKNWVSFLNFCNLRGYIYYRSPYFDQEISRFVINSYCQLAVKEPDFNLYYTGMKCVAVI